MKRVEKGLEPMGAQEAVEKPHAGLSTPLVWAKARQQGLAITNAMSFAQLCFKYYEHEYA
eukprot:scaffold19286_cov19-Tisochrysis_lutea.AAC.2